MLQEGCYRTYQSTKRFRLDFASDGLLNMGDGGGACALSGHTSTFHAPFRSTGPKIKSMSLDVDEASGPPRSKNYSLLSQEQVEPKEGKIPPRAECFFPLSSIIHAISICLRSTRCSLRLIMLAVTTADASP